VALTEALAASISSNKLSIFARTASASPAGFDDATTSLICTPEALRSAPTTDIVDVEISVNGFPVLENMFFNLAASISALAETEDVE
jgi:hypothetical protein